MFRTWTRAPGAAAVAALSGNFSAALAADACSTSISFKRSRALAALSASSVGPRRKDEGGRVEGEAPGVVAGRGGEGGRAQPGAEDADNERSGGALAGLSHGHVRIAGVVE